METPEEKRVIDDSEEQDEDDEPPSLVAVPTESHQTFEQVDNSGDNIVIPVTILTGFLGSGKTSLLNHLLISKEHGKRIAVIENEFSEGLGIEGMIAKSGVDGSSLEGFFELNNGCICCTVKDNLVSTLEQLVRHKHKFDYLIIETTGVANPGPVISCFWTDDELMSALKLDGVVCVVDALNFPRYLQDPDLSSDVRMQLCYADRVLLNKADLVSPSQLQLVESAVKEINSVADTKCTTYSCVVPEWVIDIDSFSMTNPFKLGLFANQGDLCGPCVPSSSSLPPSLSPSPLPPPPVLSSTLIPQKSWSIRDSSIHSPRFLATEGFTFPGKLHLGRLKIYLDRILYGNEGFEEDKRRKKDNSNSSNNSSNSNGNMRHGRENEGMDGRMDGGMEVDDVKMQRMRIFRMKGVLHIQDSPHLHILQSVHDLFDIKSSSFLIASDDDTTNGMNKVILIGRNLDRESVLKGFCDCLIDE